jgi:hypothetical protein
LAVEFSPQRCEESLLNVKAGYALADEKIYKTTLHKGLHDNQGLLVKVPR